MNRSVPRTIVVARRLAVVGMGLLTAWSGCVGETPELPAVVQLRSEGVMVDRRTEGAQEFTEVKAHGGETVTDATLELIATLPNLRYLSLPGTAVGDDGLRAIVDDSSITGLNLAETNVTDTGLKSVGRLTRLTRLSLRGLPVTGAGLEQLVGLESLESLDLSETQVTDSDLHHLMALPKLKTVILNGTPIDGSGLAEIGNHPTLTSIQLGGGHCDGSLNGFRSKSSSSPEFDAV